MSQLKRILAQILILIFISQATLGQSTWQWNDQLDAFKTCDTSRMEGIIDSIFLLDKAYLRSNMELIKNTVLESIDSCPSTLADSIYKEVFFQLFTSQYTYVTNGPYNKLALVNQGIEDYTNITKIQSRNDFNNLITLYIYKGNTYSALGYYEKALRTFEKTFEYSKSSNSMDAIREGLSAKYYQFMIRVEKSPSLQDIDAYFPLKQEFQELYSDTSDIGLYFSNCLDLLAAEHFINFSQQDSAEFYLNQVPKDFDLFNFLDIKDRFLSKYYKFSGEEDAYVRLQKKIINESKLVGQERRIHNNLGSFFLSKKAYLESAEHFRSALNRSLAKKDELETIIDDLAFIRANLGLAEINLIQNKTPIAQEQIHQVREILFGKLSQAEFQKDKINLLDLHAELVRLVFTYQERLQLTDLELYAYLEESKSLALYDEIRQNSFLKRDLGERKFNTLKALQDSLLSNKMLLRNSKLNTFERNLIGKRNAQLQDSIQVLRSKSSVLDHSSVAIDSLVSQYPNTSILQYYLTDSVAFLILSNHEELNTQKLKYTSKHKEDIFAFNRAVRNFRSDIDSIETLSKSLFDLLIAPIQSELKKNILVIPQGLSSAIPFEALQNSAGKYLIESHNVSYAFSLSVNEMMKKRGRSESNFLGFAPEYTASIAGYAFSPLSENIKEIDFVSDLFNTKRVFKNAEAAKANFKQHIGSADVVHVSAHADIHPRDNDFSYIAFSDTTGSKDSTLLYLSELYNMDLNTEMIVLSACNTSAGDFKEGEGVLSLARGFTYAGASSIVSSLWKVNETSTREIISTFYRELKDGSNKSSALAQAKRIYLANNSGKDIHPYYWSGIVVLGNIEPLMFSSSSWLYWLLGIFAVLFLFRRKRVNHNS